MIKSIIIAIFIVLVMPYVLSASFYIIPFSLVGNLIVFEATVMGQTGSFILDSGNSEVILNHAYFEGKPNPMSRGKLQSIHGEISSNLEYHITLHLDELSVKSYAMVIDLSPIEKRKKMNILGVVGIQVFKKYEIVIDFFSEQIFLYDLDRKGNRFFLEPTPIPTETLAFRYKEHMLYVSGRIGERELKLGVDTGVETNIFSSYLLKSSISGKVAAINRTVIGINGKTSQVPSFLVGNLQVGNLLIPSTKTLFMSMKPINKLSGPDLDGLLGQAFFRHFRTAFNFKKKEIYLWNADALEQEVITDRNILDDE